MVGAYGSNALFTGMPGQQISKDDGIAYSPMMGFLAEQRFFGSTGGQDDEGSGTNKQLDLVFRVNMSDKGRQQLSEKIETWKSEGRLKDGGVTSFANGSEARILVPNSDQDMKYMREELSSMLSESNSYSVPGLFKFGCFLVCLGVGTGMSGDDASGGIVVMGLFFMVMFC